MQKIQLIDSHTGGEPTRVIVSGGPDIGNGSVADRLISFRNHFDAVRSAVCNEPRGSEVMVGALLCEASDPTCDAGVIFFNNVGYLGMCGHGTIGLLVTLHHLGKVQLGTVRLETPVGIVTTELLSRNRVRITNVPSYRTAAKVEIEVPDEGKISGDIAWGGNWFFLISKHNLKLDLTNIDRLTEFSWRVRQAINAQGHPEVDHIELFAPGQSGGDSRNFVLCPGKAYDRSPCGTGTSAKLACLAADGVLPEGKTWIQESILGSRFEGSFRWLDRHRGIVEPTIIGEAFITAETTAMIDPQDPFGWGIVAQEEE